MSIETLCEGKVVTVAENTSIQEAANLMKDNNVGCLVVVKDKNTAQQPVGIITDRDITVKIVADNSDLKGITVAEAMSTDLLLLPKGKNMKDAIDAMRLRCVRRAPVIEDGKICGIVTADDLLLHLADNLNALRHLVKHQLSNDFECCCEH